MTNKKTYIVNDSTYQILRTQNNKTNCLRDIIYKVISEFYIDIITDKQINQRKTQQLAKIEELLQ